MLCGSTLLTRAVHIKNQASCRPAGTSGGFPVEVAFWGETATVVRAHPQVFVRGDFQVDSQRRILHHGLLRVGRMTTTSFCLIHEQFPTPTGH